MSKYKFGFFALMSTISVKIIFEDHSTSLNWNMGIMCLCLWLNASHAAESWKELE